MSNGTSAEASTSPSPAPSSIGNCAPKFGTLVPNRVFVGGISGNTTEQDLLDLFSKYGRVKQTKIISDRAGVSKGYGFVTFETEEEARKLTQEPDNIMLKERKLNIAPAVKKQITEPALIKPPYSPRLIDPTGAAAVLASNGTVFFGNGGQTYAYTNPLPMLANPNEYQTLPGVPAQSPAHATFPGQVGQTGTHTHAVSPTSQVSATGAPGYGAPLMYPQAVFFPQHYQQYQAAAALSGGSLQALQQHQWAAANAAPPSWRWVSPTAYQQACNTRERPAPTTPICDSVPEVIAPNLRTKPSCSNENEFSQIPQNNFKSTQFFSRPNQKIFHLNNESKNCPVSQISNQLNYEAYDTSKPKQIPIQHNYSTHEHKPLNQTPTQLPPRQQPFPVPDHSVPPPPIHSIYSTPLQNFHSNNFSPLPTRNFQPHSVISLTSCTTCTTTTTTASIEARALSVPRMKTPIKSCNQEENVLDFLDSTVYRKSTFPANITEISKPMKPSEAVKNSTSSVPVNCFRNTNQTQESTLKNVFCKNFSPSEQEFSPLHHSLKLDNGKVIKSVENGFFVESTGSGNSENGFNARSDGYSDGFSVKSRGSGYSSVSSDARTMSRSHSGTPNGVFSPPPFEENNVSPNKQYTSCNVGKETSYQKAHAAEQDQNFSIHAKTKYDHSEYSSKAAVQAIQNSNYYSSNDSLQTCDNSHSQFKNRFKFNMPIPVSGANAAPFGYMPPQSATMQPLFIMPWCPYPVTPPCLPWSPYYQNNMMTFPQNIQSHIQPMQSHHCALHSNHCQSTIPVTPVNFSNTQKAVSLPEVVTPATPTAPSFPPPSMSQFQTPYRSHSQLDVQSIHQTPCYSHSIAPNISQASYTDSQNVDTSFNDGTQNYISNAAFSSKGEDLCNYYNNSKCSVTCNSVNASAMGQNSDFQPGFRKQYQNNDLEENSKSSVFNPTVWIQNYASTETTQNPVLPQFSANPKNGNFSYNSLMPGLTQLPDDKCALLPISPPYTPQHLPQPSIGYYM